MGRSFFLTRFPPDRLDPLRGDPSFTNAIWGDKDPEVVTLPIMRYPGSWAAGFEDPVFREAVEPGRELPASFYEAMEEQWRLTAEDAHLRYSPPEEVADVAYRINRYDLSG